MGGKECIQILGGKAVGRWLLESCRRRLGDKIKMDLREVDSSFSRTLFHGVSCEDGWFRIMFNGRLLVLAMSKLWVLLP
jgi:hypothetical protein